MFRLPFTLTVAAVVLLWSQGFAPETKAESLEINQAGDSEGEAWTHLRRIVLAPITYVYDASKAGPEGFDEPFNFWELQGQSYFTNVVIESLRAKGFKVQYVSDDPEILQKLFGRSPEEVTEDLSLLAAQARHARINARIADDLRRRLQAIAKATHADALLFVQGAGSTSIEHITWVRAAVFQDGDLWTVAERSWFCAAIYDLRNATLVWRKEFPDGATHKSAAAPNEKLWTLFGSLPSVK
jgi:hypothetical protein